MAKRLRHDDFARMLSFGTFKPVGYTVLAYADEASARAALEHLHGGGVADEDVMLVASSKLFPEVDAHMPEATGMLGAQGYEVVLMKRYLELAARGAWWLMIWSPDSDDMAPIRALMRARPPLSAAHYGRILIEDMSEHPAGAGVA